MKSLESLPFPTTVAWTNQAVRLLDQTQLPGKETYLELTSVSDLCDAIKRLVVRGAPAIGCAAGYGVVLAAREARRANADWWEHFERGCVELSRARPTAVNLSWAVERCKHVALEKKSESPESVETALIQEAQQIITEDREMCAAIGSHGASLLPTKQATLITHCNAGALATGGAGTALAVMYAAQAAGVKLNVFADETRPLLQGGRLTAWELAKAGIDVTVICDNMAAMVMRTKKPDAIITGADRIAANGDSANKIGTYGLAILAKHHNIPFYIAAPSTTFDLHLKSGDEIPIEERDRSEIANPFGQLAIPDDAKTFNPAFDVTPASLIRAIITEKGILRAPYCEAIQKTIG